MFQEFNQTINMNNDNNYFMLVKATYDYFI